LAKITGKQRQISALQGPENTRLQLNQTDEDITDGTKQGNEGETASDEHSKVKSNRGEGKS
jgi:hypothetical protein